MNKPKGLDIIVGIGKPKPGGPPKPPDGMTGAPVMDDGPEEQPEGDDDSAMLGKIYDCLKRIESALGLDEEPEQGAPPAENPDDQGAPPA